MILLLLFSVFSACGNEAADTLSKIENYYQTLDSFSSRICAKVELSNRVQEYILDWSYSGGAYSVTVAEPESLSGINISGSESGGLTIGYDSVMLTVDPSGDVISPLEALAYMFADWHGGIAEEYCFEQCQDINTLAVSYSRVRDGRDFRQRVWFDPATCEPKYAEAYMGGALIASFDFLLFTA